VHDGVRDLSRGLRGELVAGDDGSIWYVDDEAFLRLGHPTAPWPRWLKNSRLWGFDVDRDGTLWIVAEGRRGNMKADGVRLLSYEDGWWATHLRGVDSIGPWTIAPDGTVWAVYPAKKGGGRLVVARLGAGGWEPLDGSPPGKAHDIYVTRDGEVWLAEMNHLWRYAEDAHEWQESMVDVARLDVESWGATVLADGTVWVTGEEVRLADGQPVLDERGRPAQGEPFLMRFDGTEWQRWGPADGVPAPSSPEERFSWEGLQLAPDGALWVSYATREPDGFYMGSVEWFDVDASTWQRLLPELDDFRGVVGPDGSLWVPSWGRGLYVITPEAVAGAR
jgi:hypothetical protein